MPLVDRDPDRLVGTVLGGRFVIKKCAGVDEAGARYDAWDDAETSDATVRVLHNVRPDDGSLRKLLELLTEVSALGLAGIPTLRAAGRTRARDVYYATEAISGEPLSERIAAGPLEPREAGKAIAAAGELLVECHAKGIVHGGLHAGAVILPEVGARVSLLDFGLGPISKAPNVLVAGTASAAMPYRSPEQASDDPYDARADVYSLGALLFAALTGRPPYVGSSVLEVLAHQLRGEAPSLGKANPALQGSPLQAVVDRAMRVKPDERFPSVDAMVKALRLATKEEATRVAPARAAPGAPAAEARKPHGPKSAERRGGVPHRSAPVRSRARLRGSRGSVWLYVSGGAVMALAVLLFLGWDAIGELAGGRILEAAHDEPPAEPAQSPAGEQAAAVEAPASLAPQPRARPDRSAPEPLGERTLALIAEGNEALAAGQHSRAVSRFRAAKQSAPEAPAVARGLGLAYAAAGRNGEAAAELRRYLELDPTAADLGAILARIAVLER